MELLTFCRLFVTLKMARVVKRAGALKADKIERHILQNENPK